jgi:hypothetical protein
MKQNKHQRVFKIKEEKSLNFIAIFLSQMIHHFDLISEHTSTCINFDCQKNKTPITRERSERENLYRSIIKFLMLILFLARTLIVEISQDVE